MQTMTIRNCVKSLVLIASLSVAAACANTPSEARQKPSSSDAIKSTEPAVQPDLSSDVSQLSQCAEYVKIEATEGHTVKSFAFVSEGCFGETGIVTGYTSHSQVRIGGGDDPTKMDAASLEIRDGQLVTSGADPIVIGKVRDGLVQGDLPLDLLIEDQAAGFREWELDRDFGKELRSEVVLKVR